MDYGTLYIGLACVFGLLMTWGVGANDLANVMSTTLGSKAVTVRQAIIIAIIFEFAGAIFAGGHVTATIRNGIIDTQALAHNPSILIYGMLAVLIAGTTWIALASYFGMPVSITHTIIGSIVGFGIIVVGVHAIHWRMVIPIGISWLTSPAISGIIGYLLFRSVQRLILLKPEPIHSAKRIVPIYIFFVGLILATDTVLQGLRYFNIQLSTVEQIVLVIAIAFIGMILGIFFIRQVNLTPKKMNRRLQFILVEKIFSVLMMFTACAMVFAHGSNDVANAVGPMAVVVTIVKNNGAISQTGILPVWIVVLGCSGVVIGLLTYGHKVIATVGSGITALTPSRAFAGTLAAATTVVIATSTGIPVSATQTLVGGVLGVGLARGIGALNLNVIRNIFMSWIITLPVGAGLTILYFKLLHKLFM